MYNLCCRLLLILWLRLVNSQAPVISVVSDSPYECKSSLKLRCTPSTCCGSASKIWYKGLTQIVSSGTSLDTQKYTEQDIGTSYFELTILNSNESDFDGEYSCTYAGQPSNKLTLDIDDFYCPPCWECGGVCFGFSLIGVLIAVGIGALLSKMTTDKLKDKLLVNIIVSCVVGISIDVIVSVVIGGTTCVCQKGYGYTCIFIGLGVTLPVVLAVLLIFYINAKA